MLEEVRWHACSVDRTYARLKTTEEGLSDAEVLQRQKHYGFNELPREKPLAWWVLFTRQFYNPLMIILTLAAGVSLLLGEQIDASVIFAAALLNAIIGFVQEYKANKALEALRRFIQPRAIVLREGVRLEILARELVLGDILLLQIGDRVTADARLIHSEGLRIDESSLTGESLPIEKTIHALSEQTPLADRSNMVFTGSSVVSGSGQAIIVAIGSGTELGKIALLVSQIQEEQTPLQNELNQLAHWIAIVIFGLILSIFCLGVLTGRSPVEMFQMSIALAVAAIPEGLTVSVTIILAIGMQRILHERALVRRLVAAETLGSVSVICTDKTGTITQGEMRASHLFAADKLYDLADSSVILSKQAKKVIELSVLCNDAILTTNKDGQQAQGSPTERALLLLALKEQLDPSRLRERFTRKAVVPFESKNKFMGTAHKLEQGSRVIFKGAPDRLMRFCDFSKKQQDHLEAVVTDLASKGIRVLMVISRDYKKAVSFIDVESCKGFVFEGFIGLRDPLRPEAKLQIEQARQAGVRTIMITGDHPKTAIAIAAEAGIDAGIHSVATGVELDAWTEEELQKRIARISIFARVEPHHKLRIVQALQSRGDVVAMTGDGVNDAPALKLADIGVAVGSGTEVAKQASDIVLLDSNLKTITSAIREGRVIFDNIRKSIVYLLSGSFTEIILITGSILLGLPMPLLPAQILWINLVADTFPNIGLTLEPGEQDVMSLKPHRRDEPVINRQMVGLMLLTGIITNGVLFGLYYWLLSKGESIIYIQSMMFAAVGIDSLFFVFVVKSFRRSFIQINPFANKALLVGVGVGLSLMILGMVHPFFQAIFEVVPLSLSDWSVLFMIAFVKLFSIEFFKSWFLIRQSTDR